MSSPRLLVVEDEPATRTLLCGYLRKEGCTVFSAENLQQARALCASERLDLVLLDILLPDGDGIELARELRLASPGLGIILVSMKRADRDRITGLEIGADDYVTKPFNPRELLARIRAVLRRSGVAGDEPAEQAFCFEGWCFDLAGRMLRAPDGEALSLSNAEYLILHELVRRAGEVCSKEALRTLLQQAGYEAGGRSLDVQISRLRRKLRDSEARHFIATAHGVGYIFRGHRE